MAMRILIILACILVALVILGLLGMPIHIG